MFCAKLAPFLPCPLKSCAVRAFEEKHIEATQVSSSRIRTLLSEDNANIFFDGAVDLVDATSQTMDAESQTRDATSQTMVPTQSVRIRAAIEAETRLPIPRVRY